MATKDRLSLFEMVLKASPHPGCVFTKREGLSPFNKKMKPLFNEQDKENFLKICQLSCEHAHPTVYPLEIEDSAYFQVILPMLSNKDVGDDLDIERLVFVLENKNHIGFKGPLLSSEAWHEINNPLAIISLTLQKSFKKMILNQKDIDDLLRKLNDNFARINSYIVDQINASQI